MRDNQTYNDNRCFQNKVCLVQRPVWSRCQVSHCSDTKGSLISHQAWNDQICADLYWFMYIPDLYLMDPNGSTLCWAPIWTWFYRNALPSPNRFRLFPRRRALRVHSFLKERRRESRHGRHSFVKSTRTQSTPGHAIETVVLLYTGQSFETLVRSWNKDRADKFDKFANMLTFHTTLL